MVSGVDVVRSDELDFSPRYCGESRTDQVFVWSFGVPEVWVPVFYINGQVTPRHLCHLGHGLLDRAQPGQLCAVHVSGSGTQSELWIIGLSATLSVASNSCIRVSVD